MSPAASPSSSSAGHASDSRTGLLLVNLGTPDAPTPAAVRRYLRQFLMDPRVIDIPAAVRWMLVNLVILPFRPRRSAAAYASIWTERGSPLLAHSQDLVELLRKTADDRFEIELGMRYGSPSIDSALGALIERGCESIVVMPQFPQRSEASWGSAVAEVYSAAARRDVVPALEVVPPFYDDPDFLDALAEVTRPSLEDPAPERWLISFHGLPERHIERVDRACGGSPHCLVSPTCCDVISDDNRDCYRAHCFATARGLASRLGLAEGAWEVVFQSRLGRTPWISPYTDRRILELAADGVKRLGVISPSFTSDCLETVEEIGIRGREEFLAAGGEELRLAPCLNSSPVWAEAITKILSRSRPGR